MATQVAANPSNAPVEEKPKGKKGAPEKQEYRKDGDPLLKEFPKDYSPKKHKRLTEDDFEPAAVHFLYDNQAAALEEKAAGLRRKAEAIRKTGSFSAEHQKSAKRVVELKLEMQKLMEELQEAGENVDDL